MSETPRDLEDIPLSEVLQRLYDAEINAGVSSFWDGGFRAWIGDESNGIKREMTFSVGKGANDYATWTDLWQAVSLFLMESADDLYVSWDVERQSDEDYRTGSASPRSGRKERGGLERMRFTRAYLVPALQKRNVRDDVLRCERPADCEPESGKRPLEDEVRPAIGIDAYCCHVLLLRCYEFLGIGFWFFSF